MRRRRGKEAQFRIKGNADRRLNSDKCAVGDEGSYASSRLNRRGLR